jgi:hypothetical protein
VVFELRGDGQRSQILCLVICMSVGPLCCTCGTATSEDTAASRLSVSSTRSGYRLYCVHHADDEIFQT